MNIRQMLYTISVWIVLFPIALSARNIDLSTVPPREQVQLTIYNSADLTLVRDVRTVSFKPGLNPLQFSWANTLIDPTSVELRFINHSDKLQLENTRFPHDKPQMLYWQVRSEYQGSVQIEISYFTSGINWQADYTAIANPEESHMALESFVRVNNQSGEDYENAQVRLIVGTVNLVEEIQSLAQKTEGQSIGRRQLKKSMRALPKAALRGRMNDLLEEADMMAATEIAAPKEVSKESLSEYFLYTIEGTETIPHGWSKRLRSFSAAKVPLNIQYRYRPREYGDRLVRLYLLRNDEESNLGSTPLPNGMVRIFRQNEKQQLAYLAQQAIQYVPIGDKLELNLGEDPAVIFELIQVKAWRDEILFKLHGANVYRKLGGGMKIDTRSTVAGWNEHALYTQRVRNYTSKPINLEIRRSYDGDSVFRSQLKAKSHDYRTVEYTAQVAAKAQADLYYEILQRFGKNAKKNNLELERTRVH